MDDKLLSEVQKVNESVCMELKSQQTEDLSNNGDNNFDRVSDINKVDIPKGCLALTSKLTEKSERKHDEVTNSEHTHVSTPSNTHQEENWIEKDGHISQEEDKFRLNDNHYSLILQDLQKNTSLKVPKNLDIKQLKDIFMKRESLSSTFKTDALKSCIRSITSVLKENNIRYLLSWPKYKVVQFLYSIAIGEEVPKVESKRRKKTAPSLKVLCQQKLHTFSKEVLNIINAEYEFPTEKEKWDNEMPFNNNLEITGVGKQVTWFSKHEFSTETLSYRFFLLDCHHILTNARIKCCKTGIPESGISRQAWVKLTSREGGNILSSALVEDLVDCQSNTFAKQTFSETVEEAMIKNGDLNEALFCRLIREWYSAEDDPGISALERCNRRLAFKQWLLKGVRFDQFPPPGAYVKGIPIVMYEGLLTNIDRRLQLYPFVKSGNYNVRSLGTLEAENLFGAFQDLDRNGSGVIRPDDIPAALSTACEMLCYRYNKQRGFYLNTSKTKVYPFHELMDSQNNSSSGSCFRIPDTVNVICPRNHPFDDPERSKSGSVLKKTLRPCISEPSMPARGIRPVRQYHRLDESKILPHVRKGLNFEDELLLNCFSI